MGKPDRSHPPDELNADVGRRPAGGPRISVVIPAKNEARNIGWVVERLPSIVDELVLVDGRSTDATVEVARALWPTLTVVVDDKPGKGAALRAGFAAATGDYVVMLDADGSMDPAEIGAFVAKLDQGFDLAKGSRRLAGGGSADISILRALGNRCLLEFANVLLGSSFSELCYGYAAFRRPAVLGLELTAVGFEIETQLFLRAIREGLRVAEVSSFEAPRRSGTSNLHTFRDGWRVLKTIVAERVRHAGPRRDVGSVGEGIAIDVPIRVGIPVLSGQAVASSQVDFSPD
jgi:glycosyltransferase involved in cell wall biosynthesis